MRSNRCAKLRENSRLGPRFCRELSRGRSNRQGSQAPANKPSNGNVMPKGGSRGEPLNQSRSGIKS